MGGGESWSEERKQEKPNNTCDTRNKSCFHRDYGCCEITGIQEDAVRVEHKEAVCEIVSNNG